MTTTGDVYIQVLGEHLRARRKRMGRTRKEVLSVFPLPEQVSLQTYATWELGTRVMPVSRLAMLSAALGTTPHEVLTDVDRVVFGGPGANITVDLTKVATLAAPELSHVARWARAGISGGRTAARLSSDDVNHLAALGNVPVGDLAAALVVATIPTAA